jgi:hypothetical protein
VTSAKGLGLGERSCSELVIGVYGFGREDLRFWLTQALVV